MEIFSSYTTWMVLVFIIGYAFITIEHVVKIDKATTALLTGIFLWVIQYAHGSSVCGASLDCLGEHISSISQIVFFLMGALAIVEIISVHKGFSMISDSMQISSKRKLLWVLSLFTFFLSDNNHCHGDAPAQDR